MKTITLRQLVRETRRIKQFTETGASFLVTDHGKPLWRISPADSSENSQRDEEIDTELDALLAEPVSDISLSDLVIEGRR